MGFNWFLHGHCDASAARCPRVTWAGRWSGRGFGTGRASAPLAGGCCFYFITGRGWLERGGRSSQFTCRVGQKCASLSKHRDTIVRLGSRRAPMSSQIHLLTEPSATPCDCLQQRTVVRKAGSRSSVLEGTCFVFDSGCKRSRIQGSKPHCPHLNMPHARHTTQIHVAVDVHSLFATRLRHLSASEHNSMTNTRLIASAARVL